MEDAHARWIVHMTRTLSVGEVATSSRQWSMVTECVLPRPWRCDACVRQLRKGEAVIVCREMERVARLGDRPPIVMIRAREPR